MTKLPDRSALAARSRPDSATIWLNKRDLEAVATTHSLTPREREVLLWAAQGKSSSEVAEILHISKKTIEAHTQNAIRKLGAVNRTQAVAIALREWLIR